MAGRLIDAASRQDEKERLPTVMIERRRRMPSEKSTVAVVVVVSPPKLARFY